MRIPITMCHGTNLKRQPPFDAARHRQYYAIAASLGFESITYEQLDAWKHGDGELPDYPIMFDFDHPTKAMRHEVLPALEDYGYRANLFVNTGPLEALYANPLPPDDERLWMTWEELGDLLGAGWHLGAHTHTHPNLSELSTQDPSGELVRAELVKCDEILQTELGIQPRDFAFTGTTWSSAAEREVTERYRFGRLWIVGAMYEADGQPIRYADLVGVAGNDEADGGPPAAARYITRSTPDYRLPSMELERLIFEFDAFRAYLEGALVE